MSKKNDFRIVLLDYDDMTLGDYDNTGENEQVAYFIWLVTSEVPKKRGKSSAI